MINSFVENKLWYRKIVDIMCSVWRLNVVEHTENKRDLMRCDLRCTFTF